MPLSGESGKFRVGLLGPDGTFSAQAGYSNAERMGYGIEPVWYKCITDCFRGVKEGEIERAIVPFMNSTSTAYQINETMACLREYANDHGIRICGEEVVTVSFYLAALPGTGIGDIREVHSKDKALEQCKGLRNILGHDYEPVPSESTAAAAEKLLNDRAADRAVLVSKRALNLYDELEILASDVQDNKSNYTRFHVIGLDDHSRTGHDATKIMYEYRNVDKCGLLYNTARVFKKKKINIRYMQLLPVDGSLLEITFFMDLKGHRTDPRLSKALKKLEKKKGYIKRFAVLGSYPRMDL